MKTVFYTGPQKKLSKILCEKLPDYSYFYFQKLLRKGDVKVNGKRVKEDISLSDAEIIVYCKEKPFSPEVVFENDLIKVFYKFSGISSEDFAEKVKQTEPELVLVHRLDTNTTGIIIFAKGIEIFEAFKKAFSDHLIEKHYYAEVFGNFPKQAEFDDYMTKDVESGRVFLYKNDAKDRRTIKTICVKKHQKGDISVLDVQPVTGRTHQIRAHLAFHGYPVVGDEKYGDADKNKRLKTHIQHLCAVSITFHTASVSLLSSLDGIRIDVAEPHY